MEKYTCQRPIHPGELLKEEIECNRMPPLAADAACRTDGHILQSAERHPELPPSAHHEHGYAARSGVGHQRRPVDADAARLQHAASHPRQVLHGTACPNTAVRGIAVSSGTHRKFPVPPLSPPWRRAGRLFSSLPKIKDIKIKRSLQNNGCASAMPFKQA